MRVRSLARPILAMIFAFMTSLGATKAALCDDVTRAPKEGEIYRTSIRFGERDWPLPEGDWEVLAYIPKVFDTGRSFRIALAKFDQNHEFGALIMYNVGEVGDLPNRGLEASGVCDPPQQAYQGDQRIRDKNTDYSCWSGVTVNLAHLPVDHLSDVVRLKLQNFKPSGRFPAVQSLIKKNGLLANVFVWLNPNQLISNSSRVRMGFPTEGLWSDGPHIPDSFEGERLALLLLLREWAIRWQEKLQLVFEADSQLKIEATALPMPVLQNPNSSIPMLPDMGLRQGMSFSDIVPIGPFLVPLPPGTWKVIIRNPQIHGGVHSDGAISIDQVTLANVQDGVFHGFIQLEANLLGSTTNDHPCKTPRGENLAAYQGHDEYCAVLNDLRLYADDAKFPLVQELTKQGVRMPNRVIGSVFMFSDRLIKLNVYVAFAPNHVGLPDIELESPGLVPPEWTFFVPKWRRWTTDWAEYLLAGLDGTLSAQALPAKWRDLDLKSERSEPVMQPKLGDTYTGTFPLGGRRWPLPPGTWEVMALTPRVIQDQLLQDEIYLVNHTEEGVQGVVNISFSRPDIETPVKGPIAICMAVPDLIDERVHFELGLLQDCWAIRIGSNEVLRKSFHGYEALEAAVKARGLSMPEALLYSAFSIVDRERLANAFYGFPAVSLARGLKPSEANNAATWNPKNGPIGPVRTAAFRTMHDWAHAWHEAVKLGFDGKLKSGPLPRETTSHIPVLTK